MRRIFKNGDHVYYERISGTILGIFNTCMAFFISDNPEPSLYSFKGLRLANKNDAATLMFFIRDKFGTNLSDDTKVALKQKRFIIVTLSELNHSPKLTTTLQSLIRKRHFLLVMAKNYLRGKHSEERIERICSKVEAIQIEIDAEEKCLMLH
jgi:hypothetical protein